MAEAIKQATEILALKATLLSRESPPQMELSLERFRRGENLLENVWRVGAEAAGLPGMTGPDREMPLTLPETVLRPLVDAVNQAATDGSEPLWLHFVKPYGMIGAMDWEGALAPAMSRPLFRLPDFLESVRTHPEAMEAVVVCDLPTDEPLFELDKHLLQLVEAMRVGLRSRPTTFNLFVSDHWRAAVAKAFQDMPRVVVHAPPTNHIGWLDWVGEAMSGRHIDWLQFLMHADGANLSPSLAFTQGPGTQESLRTAAYVSPTEVAQCLNRLSAWGCGFATPPYGSPAAVRYFADAVAQVRPGPVLFQDAEPTTWLLRLADRLAYLFFPTFGGLPDQPNPGGFLYVQPERIGFKLKSPYALDTDPAAAIPAELVAAPSWAASANAFITSARQQWGLDAALGSVSATTTLDEPSAWVANTVGGFERIISSDGPSPTVKAVEDTLKALSALTGSLARSEKSGS